ncbi:unnamed protein product [Paramecium pentaurelia]|uniref:Uncharacterized protein n=1 Tax=Paramecium pentaurelia TaxID=43138 RepID=A0A8S1UL34_9CILI|nr:unnamed protein product [Paramecium pentaurelia]
MLYVILLLISILKAQDEDEIEYDVVETLQSACRCSQILSEVDCQQFCFWKADSDGKTGKCRDKLCSDYLDKNSCNSDQKNLCYFNSEENLCKNLRGDCTSLDIQEECETKQNCQWLNQPDEDGVQCQIQEQPEEEIPVICNNIKQQEICDSSQEDNSGYYCSWLLNPIDEGEVQTNQTNNESTTRLLKVDNTGYCSRFSVTKCTDINDIDADDSIKEMLCNRFPDTCRYTIQTSNGITVTGTNFNLVSYSCEQRACKDYGTQQLCEDNYIVPDFEGYLHLCNWTSTSCNEGLIIEKFSLLNSPEKCYKEETLYQLTWNQQINKCTKCPGLGYLLSLLFSLYIIVI